MSWDRLEFTATRYNISDALAARIADPLWALSRQWQVGEFAGEDAATPMTVRMDVESSPITAAGPTESPRPLGEQIPLEAAIECEAVRTSQGEWMRSLESGAQLLRMLSANGLGVLRREFRTQFALVEPQTPYKSISSEDRVSKLAAKLSCDGAAVHAWVRGAMDLRPFVMGHDLVAAQIEALEATLANWAVEYDQAFLEPPNNASAWRSDIQRYDASIKMMGGEMRASEHVGGRLSWDAFDFVRQPKRAAFKESRSVLATPGRFRGMPAPRWWAFEDGNVHFGDIEGGADEVAAALVTAFSAVQSDDWMVVPVSVPNRALVRLANITVTDSFGEEETIEPVSEGRDNFGWGYFTHAGAEPEEYKTPWLLMPGGVVSEKGEAIEDVAFHRDEQANIVWGIERRVESPFGHGFERRTQVAESSKRNLGNDLWSYQLQTSVADGWIPLVQMLSGEGTDAVPILRRGRLAHWREEKDGAWGRILEAGQPLSVQISAVPPAGMSVERSFQRVRTMGEGSVVWVGRTVRNALSLPPSGLSFDVLNGPRPSLSDAGSISDARLDSIRVSKED